MRNVRNSRTPETCPRCIVEPNVAWSLKIVSGLQMWTDRLTEPTWEWNHTNCLCVCLTSYRMPCQSNFHCVNSDWSLFGMVAGSLGTTGFGSLRTAQFGLLRTVLESSSSTSTSSSSSSSPSSSSSSSSPPSSSLSSSSSSPSCFRRVLAVWII